MKFTFAFNSRDTYLYYRAGWRVKRTLLITAARAAKLAIKDTNRAFSKVDPLGGFDWSCPDASARDRFFPAYYPLRQAHLDIIKCRARVEEHQSELYAARHVAAAQMNMGWDPR
jgi:hypothetical protein